MNKDSFCRLCAENNVELSLISINDPVALNLNLKYKIYHCFHLKIEQNDILSEQICSKCCGQIIFTYNFYECIQKAQETLKALTLVKPKNYILPEIIEKQDIIKLESFDNSQPTNLNENDFVDELLKKTDTINQETQTHDDVFSDCESEVMEPTSKQRQNQTLKPKNEQFMKSEQNYENSINDVQKTDTCSLNNSESKNDEENEFTKLLSVETDDDDDEKCTDQNVVKEGWGTYPWKCFSCDVQFSSVTELRKHHEVEHDQIAQYVCIDCDKPPFAVYHGFLAHVRMHRPQLKYSCDLCGKYFIRKHVLERHRLYHSELKPYICQKCGKTFRIQSSLYLHTKSHLPEDEKNLFACDICPKKFGTKQNLIAHKRIHTGIKDYTCDQCGKSFVQKGNLENHMLTHTAVRPYNCDMCSKSFKTLMRLKKHESVHSGLKPHQCDICGRQFREKGTLKEHHRIHTGAMPFTCEFCGKSFRFKGILTTHRRQHTGERPYSCIECQHHFTNWPNYNKHMKRRHGINTSVTVRKPQTIPPTGMPCRNPPGTIIVPTSTSVPTITTLPDNAIQQQIIPQSLPHMFLINSLPIKSTPSACNDIDPTLMNTIGVNVALTNGVTTSSLIAGTPITTDRTSLIGTTILDNPNPSYYILHNY